MTTNPYAKAVEAARLALQDRTGRTRQSTQRDAETAVDAATPRLLAPIRAPHRSVPIPPGNDLQCAECRKPWPCCTTLTLDAIEAGATSEGGRDE